MFSHVSVHPGFSAAHLIWYFGLPDFTRLMGTVVSSNTVIGPSLLLQKLSLLWRLPSEFRSTSPHLVSLQACQQASFGSLPQGLPCEHAWSLEETLHQWGQEPMEKCSSFLSFKWTILEGIVFVSQEVLVELSPPSPLPTGESLIRYLAVAFHLPYLTCPH